MIKGRLAEGLSGLRSLKADWERLHATAKGGLFQSYVWAESWAGVIPNADDIRIVTVENGSLQCILPLIVQRRLGIRRLRWLGREVTDYCDAIGAGDWDISELAAAVRRYLPPCDLVELGQIQAAGPASRIFASALQPEQDCPRIDLAQATLPKDILYAERHAAAAGSLTYHIARNQAERADIVAFVITEKRRALLRRSRSTGEFDVTVTPFLRRLAAMLYPTRTEPLFSSLRLDGQTIAAQIGFIEFGTLLYYLPAFDFAFRRYSPGHLLLLQLLRDARNSGLSAIDLLRGQEDYKFKWTGQAQTLSSAEWSCSLRGKAFAWARDAKRGLGRSGQRRVADHT